MNYSKEMIRNLPVVNKMENPIILNFGLALFPVNTSAAVPVMGQVQSWLLKNNLPVEWPTYVGKMDFQA